MDEESQGCSMVIFGPIVFIMVLVMVLLVTIVTAVVIGAGAVA